MMLFVIFIGNADPENRGTLMIKLLQVEKKILITSGYNEARGGGEAKTSEISS